MTRSKSTFKIVQYSADSTVYNFHLTIYYILHLSTVKSSIQGYFVQKNSKSCFALHMHGQVCIITQNWTELYFTTLYCTELNLTVNNWSIILNWYQFSLSHCVTLHYTTLDSTGLHSYARDAINSIISRITPGITTIA